MVKTRFAPSPTGYLHVGGLRTALYNYVFAKKYGGKFLLRIEDTDRERYVADGVANILKSLAWAGIAPDEGVTGDEEKISQVGDNGPYIQSERLEIYKKYADQLVEAGQAYYCFCTSERLADLRDQQQRKKLPTGYDGKCLSIGPEEAKKRVEAGEKYTIRMRMPKEGETAFNDLIRGEVKFKNELVDDQVLIKSDGYPTYHLAVVVDDHLMEITHIIRGEEWISSVPKHIQLYKYFGWTVPQMAHLPLLLNADKSKLSKRQGDVSVEDYRKKGYLSEALVNFVAFLGWNPGTDKEIYSLEELSNDFEIEKIGKSGAVFNVEKLNWMNKEYIKKLTPEQFVELSMPYLLDAHLLDERKLNDEDYKRWLSRVLALERERIAVLSELPEAIKFAFALPEYDSKMLVWKKSSPNEVKKILTELAELLNNFSVQDWNAPNLEKKIGEWIEQNKYANGPVLWPLRVALSGQDKSPGPYEIAAALGKDETLTRIRAASYKIK